MHQVRRLRVAERATNADCRGQTLQEPQLGVEPAGLTEGSRRPGAGQPYLTGEIGTPDPNPKHLVNWCV